MKKSTLLKTSAIGAAIVLMQATQWAAAEPNPNAPTPYDSNPFVIPANSVFYACNFDLRVQYLGKAKTITLPGSRFVSTSTSPGLKAILTNVSDESKTVTLNITGSIKNSMDEYGNNVYTANGRNLMGDPTTGLVLVMGNFKYVFDSAGTLVTPLNGVGRMLQVCEMVE